MHRSRVLALGLGAALALAGATTVLGHSGSGEAGIQVEPANVTAGATVVLAGTGLEPNGDRVLTLVGTDFVVQFGSVTTTAEGMFSKELTIPAHLPSGTYTFQAIGDETLTVPLAVTAAAGGAAESPAANEANSIVIPRQRSPIELGALLVLVALAVAVGGLLVMRAERFRGAAAA
jgi:hypothetical protein